MVKVGGDIHTHDKAIHRELVREFGDICVTFRKSYLVRLQVGFLAAAPKLNLDAALVVRYDSREGLQRGIINKLCVLHNLDEIG